MKANHEYEAGEYEFHEWMKKYWTGVPRVWLSQAAEYFDTGVQIGWEIWQRFFPKDEPDVKVWNMFRGARYRDGKLIESYDHGALSSTPPAMVEYADYAALWESHRKLKQLYGELEDQVFGGDRT